MTLLLKEFPFLRVLTLASYSTITINNLIIGIKYRGNTDFWKHFIACMERGHYSQNYFII